VGEVMVIVGGVVSEIADGLMLGIVGVTAG
jgi:hypothetical protein